MFKLPLKNQYLRNDSLEELRALCDRLYCAWNCVFYGDPMVIAHQETVGGQLRDIWSQIDAILESETERKRYVDEEVKKFEQGFSYRPTNGQVMD